MKSILAGLAALAALIAAPAAAQTTLSATPTTQEAGLTLTTTWSGIPAPTAMDWIAIFTPSAPNTAYPTYIRTNGQASGSLPFTIPGTLAPGTYQLRLFTNDTYTVLATSSNFTVTRVNPDTTVSSSPAAVPPGGTITVTWGGMSVSTPSDWFGVFATGAPNGPGTYVAGKYTNGQTSGSLPNTIPATLAAGTYQVRIFYNNSYDPLAVGNNFSVTPLVSGTVTLNGAAMANVSFSATDGATCTSSNASGQYSCAVPAGWSGTISASASGYGFTPSSRSYSNVTAHQSAQNYTATPGWYVTGTVSLDGAALPGAALTATSGVTCSTSDAAGQYRCFVPPDWTGSVTPSLAGYTFAPASRGYASVSAAQTNQDFSAIPGHFITGRVSINGLGLPGAALAATNGVTCSSSDGAGQYSCFVPANWSGSVTPSLTGYTFTPASRSYASVAASPTNQDFTAALPASAAPFYFIHVDHLNTPRLVANDQGQAVWRWDQQEPFGVNVPDENPSGLGAFELPLRLPGQYFDKETNLYYNYFRDYDPSIGRYGESDPIGLRGGINTYAYVAGKPLSRTDPLGLKSRVCCKNIPFISGLSDARHCYIETINARRTTYGLSGGPDTPDGNGYTRQDADFDIREPQGDCGPWNEDCGTDECVDKTARGYPNPSFYGLLTYNSNTFAGTIARKCGLQRPSGNFPTPGWDNPPSVPASGVPQLPFNSTPPRMRPQDPFNSGGAP